MCGSSSSNSYQLTFVFFSYGFLCYLYHDTVLTAVEDLLEGTEIPTAFAGCTINVSGLSCFVLCLLAHEKIPVSVKMWGAFIFYSSGMLVLSFVTRYYLKVLAICLVGFGTAFAENGSATLTARYDEYVVHAFSTGGGLGRLMGALLYTVLTTYLCVAPQVVFLIYSFMAVAYPLYYYIIIKKTCTSAPNGEYKLVNTIAYDDESQGNTEPEADDVLTCREKLVLLYRYFPCYLVNFITSFVQNLTLQSILSTLVFPKAPFRPRDHYQYFAIVIWSGELIGRCYGYIAHCCGKVFTSGRSFSLQIKSWIVIAIAIFQFFLLVAAGWWHIFPNVWVAIAITFMMGLMTGVSYVLSLSVCADESLNDSHRQFTRSTSVLAFTLGGSFAGGLALYLEPLLKLRCFRQTHTIEYCIARYQGLGKKPCFHQKIT